MATMKIGPLTRIEGHLDIDADIDILAGSTGGKVVGARSSGTMFRGFEAILKGRDPYDAPHLTQRICGVCPVAHGMASSTALESAFKLPPTDSGRIMRNLILGSNFLQSHILHFYHLAALDYIDTTGILERAPWKPRYVAPDMIRGTTAETLVGHYVFVPGGCTAEVTATRIADFGALLSQVASFINNVYVPDVEALASLFPEYKTIGRGCGNLLAYGVFDLDVAGTRKLLARGRYTNGTLDTVDPTKITEYVKYSYYSSGSNLNPANGATTPAARKTGAYSWIKAPRYLSKVHEVGSLARMWINGDYRAGISVMDRQMARALEAKKIAQAMAGWLKQLVPGRSTWRKTPPPVNAVGLGLTEAARGALGHWVRINNSVIDQYQIITPTAWNASPLDDLNQNGAIEQALRGVPVANTAQPIELLRVVHSFDPCLACSVHAIRTRGDEEATNRALLRAAGI
jgi:hydrogenase large subunit